MSEGNDRTSDRKLGEILREANSLHGETSRVPDREAVAAYLTGQATPEQEASVDQAMLQNADFAEEMLELMQGQDDASDEALNARMEEVQVPQQLLNQVRPEDHGRNQKEHKGQPIAILSWLEWLWTPQVGFAMAAVLALVLVLPQPGDGPIPSPVFSLPESRTFRGSERVMTVEVEQEVDFVDLMGQVDLKLQVRETIRARLYREPGSILVLDVVPVSRFQLVNDNPFPVLRIDPELLQPGTYSLKFTPVKADGEADSTRAASCRFQVPGS
jgi:hypothetical protein